MNVPLLSRARSRRGRGGLAVLFVVAVLVLPRPAHAADDGAVDAAFDALFAMPQGLPDDSAFRSQSEQPPADQAALIDLLDDRFQAGAPVDAYRHGGTLLHHAIRAGLDDVALALLAHGADPRRRVRDEETGTEDTNDALQLALAYRRWRVVDVLMKRADMRPTSDLDLAFRWSALFDQRDAAVPAGQGVDVLLKRGLRLPAGAPGDCLLQLALKRGAFALALASPAREPRSMPWKTLGTSPRAVVVNGGCGEPAPASALGYPWDVFPPLSSLAPAEVERLDARLATPLLPWLLHTIRRPEDVDTLWRLALKRPTDDPAFVRTLLPHVLDARIAPALSMAVLRRMPAAAVAAALGDYPVTVGWFQHFGSAEPEVFAWALAEVPDAVLKNDIGAALRGLQQARTGAPDAIGEATGAPAPAWSALLARAPTPLPETPMTPRLLMTVPEGAWPALFGRGYQAQGDELGYIVLNSTPAQLRTRWPVFRAAVAPAARAHVVAELISGFAAECRAQWTPAMSVEAERLRLLLDAGDRPAAPVRLGLGCARRMPAELRERLAAVGGVLLSKPAAAPRFVLAPAHCTMQPESALRSQLASNKFAAAHDDAEPSVVQALEVPGEAACALLATGGHVSSRAFIDQESFYDGAQRLTPCGDGTLLGELWRVTGGRVVAEPVGMGALEGLLPLRDAQTGDRFVLSLPLSGSTCSSGLPSALYAWVQDAAAWHLRAVEAGDEARVALEDQCELGDPEPCFGRPSKDDAAGAPPAGASPSSVSDTPFEIAAFVDRVFAAQRGEFIAALMALDAARLEQQRAAGLPPGWIAAGLAAVDASTLPVEARRQRSAWLFRQKAGLPAALASEQGAAAALRLVDWLPREDWRPVVAALGKGSTQLDELRAEAQRQGKAPLACLFAVAAGKPCDAARR